MAAAPGADRRWGFSSAAAAAAPGRRAPAAAFHEAAPKPTDLATQRWGFAGAAAAAPGRRAPAAGVLEAAPKPTTNLPIQRGALPWGHRPMPPAPNAWGSSSLQSLKKGEDYGLFVKINDRPSSPGSSSTSTDGSDLLDSPVASGRTSHDSVTVISRPQGTELRSGSWKFPHPQASFSDVLTAPLSTIAKKRPTSNRKGFTICADDFPVLDLKSSLLNGQQGHCFQGRPSFSSVVIAARDEQRKTPLTGGDPVSTANFSWEPEQAQLYATQTPDICMPPPCIDYWHPPPDHPPDRNGFCLGGAVSYGLCKAADNVESFTHDGHSLLNQGREERHGPHGVYHPENSCYAHVPVDSFVKSLPHVLLEEVKDNHSDALEKQPVIKKGVALLEKMKCLPHHIHGKVKGIHSDALENQPVIKKDVALLEKIRCLNIKARNLRARNMPEISLCKESNVECPKSLNLNADHVANDVPFSAATDYITSAFDMANSVSERSNHVLAGTSNMSAILVTSDLSEGHVTEFSEAKKMGNSADNHVYGVVDTSTNLCGSSASPVKNTEIKIMESIDTKGMSHSNESRTQMHLQMEEKRRHAHSHGRNLRGSTPASGPAGGNKGFLIHNVIPSAKNNGISTMEHIARKSASQSHENSSPKRLQMENRQRQVRPQERVLRELSNIAGSTEDITTVYETHMNTRNAEAKPHVDLSTQSKNRPVSPCVFGTENTETSGLRKAPVSGVIINSSIITMQAALARGFTVGSIMLGDASVASVNQEKIVANEVHHDTTSSCASPRQRKQSGKNQHDEHQAKDLQGGDNIMCTEVKEPSKEGWPEAGGMNCMAIPAPIQPSGNQSIVLQETAPAKTYEMERHAHKPKYKELHLQNPRQILQAEKHTKSSDKLSTSKLENKSHNEALDSSTAKSEIKTEPENREDEKISKHLGRSSAASDEELSDQMEQVEKQLDSTHVAATRYSEPAQMVSLPGYTWGEHCASHSQRQYHVDVDGQGNVWTRYAANVSGITQGASALPTAYVLPPGPISVPENNALNGSSAPVWTWDTTEGILTSDIGNVPAVGTAITGRSRRELTQSMYGFGQMDLHSMQFTGGMSYEAVAVNPQIQYHAGLAHQQVNPAAWFPHSHGQQDVSYHSSSGTGVYLPQMDVGAAMQTHGVSGPVLGAGHPGYQLMPVESPGAAYNGSTVVQTHGVTGPGVGAGHPGYQPMPVGSPGAAYTGSAMVSAGHPAAVAWTWGAAYGEHVYYA